MFAASKNVVMVEVERLLKDLSEKFDTIREDIDSLKERRGIKKEKEQAFTPAPHQVLYTISEQIEVHEAALIQPMRKKLLERLTFL